MAQNRIRHTEKELARRAKKPILPPPSELDAPVPVIIFIASSTPEKVRDFRLIAETRRYPIIFEDVHELISAFHHVDEVKNTYDGNAGDKLAGAKPEDFREGGKYYERVQNYLSQRGLPANSKLFMASEDSGYRFEKEVWDKVNKDGIPEETLKRINDDKSNRTYTGPGVQTAPVVSAVLGDYNLMGRVYDAVQKLGRVGQPISILQNSSLHLEAIGNVKGTKLPNRMFREETFSFLHYPDQKKIKGMLPEQKVSNLYTIKSRKGYDTSYGELGKVAIANHSVRSMLVDEIYNHYFSKERKAGYHPNYLPAFRDQLYDGEFKVGSLATTQDREHDEFLGNLLANTELNAKFRVFKDPLPSAANADTYTLLSNIERTMAGSDSVILFPDMQNQRKAHNNKSERMADLVKLYTLSSLVVNRQINPRDANKPVIVLNHDGSWNDALAIHNRLANLGTTKEHAMPLTSEFRNSHNVHIQTNGYFDVIGTPQGSKKSTYDETMHAAIELLQEKTKSYYAGHTANSPVEEFGDKSGGDDKFKVAIFCSANNENKYLNEAVEKISYHLARKNFGIVYGGGDRYTMGEVLKGVQRYRQDLMAHGNISEEQAKSATYVAGYSTSTLLQSETEKGKFSPALNYAKQNIDIYQRMADMLDESDVVVAAPGGAGTVQEWAAAMILNHMRPEGQRKPIVFFDPKLNTEQEQVWDVALQNVLGKHDYKILTDNKTSFARREELSKQLGIYIETDEDSVHRRLTELRKSHVKRLESSRAEQAVSAVSR